jgi:hypothetical protein
MAGMMKFSEVPTYPYTCRSLHRVRTGKMRTNQTFASLLRTAALVLGIVSAELIVLWISIAKAMLQRWLQKSSFLSQH